MFGGGSLDIAGHKVSYTLLAAVAGIAGAVLLVMQLRRGGSSIGAGTLAANPGSPMPATSDPGGAIAPSPTPNPITDTGSTPPPTSPPPAPITAPGGLQYPAPILVGGVWTFPVVSIPGQPGTLGSGYAWSADSAIYQHHATYNPMSPRDSVLGHPYDPHDPADVAYLKSKGIAA